MKTNRLDRLAWVGGIALFACATTQSADRHSQVARENFGGTRLPTLVELRELARVQVSRPRVAMPATEVLSWELRGSPPRGIDAADVASTWNTTDTVEHALSVLVTNRPVTPTESMRCFARELASFAARNNGDPPPDLQQFMAAACRMHSQNFTSAEFSVDANASGTSAPPTNELATGVAQRMTDFAAHAEGSIGVATAHFGSRYSVVAVAAVPQVRFEQESRDSYGSLLLRGEVLGPTGNGVISIVANQRDGSVNPCAAEPVPGSQRFVARCGVPVTGLPSLISIELVTPGLMFSRSLAEVFVGGDQRLNTWQLPDSPLNPLGPNETTTTGLSRQLNQVRAAAGRPAVEFGGEAESIACSVSAHLHPGLRTSAERSNFVVAERAMMSGYGVPRMVQVGVVGRILMPSRNVSRILTAALASPADRMNLMSPNVRYGAFCPLTAPDGFAGIAYVLWQVVDPTAMHDVESVWSLVQAERARRGLSPTQRWEGPPQAAALAIRAIDTGEMTIANALDRSLDSAIEEVGTGAVQGVQGAVVASYYRGNGFLWMPDEFLAPSFTLAHIAATWYRGTGSPWAVQLLFVYTPNIHPNQ